MKIDVPMFRELRGHGVSFEDAVRISDDERDIYWRQWLLNRVAMEVTEKKR